MAVGDPKKHPEFAGTVASVDTRDFWREVDESPTSQDYHYNRNAETYMLVGDALGRAMVGLLGGKAEPLPQAPRPKPRRAGRQTAEPTDAGEGRRAEGAGPDHPRRHRGVLRRQPALQQGPAAGGRRRAAAARQPVPARRDVRTGQLLPRGRHRRLRLARLRPGPAGPGVGLLQLRPARKPCPRRRAPATAR